MQYVNESDDATLRWWRKYSETVVDTKTRRMEEDNHGLRCSSAIVFFILTFLFTKETSTFRQSSEDIGQKDLADW